MGKKLEQELHKRRYMRANKYMKRYSTSLVIREIQMKTTARNHNMLEQMQIQSLTFPSIGQDLEGLAL